MGIHNLTKIIKKYYRPIEHPLSFYRTKKMAFDASLLTYQYLIAIRSDGAQLAYNSTSTSHISGFFYKIINLAEIGIKPLFVFDGKPPQVKSEEIARRNERRKNAAEKYSEAEEQMDKIEMEKYDKRKLKIGKEHTDEIKLLLDAMGVAYTISENEAEAFCATLCRKGIVDYVCTEDMDALCFRAPVLLKNFVKDTVAEYRLDEILRDMKLEFSAFMDLCILLGCDYAGTIKGIGPMKAETLIRRHGNIENIVKELNITGYEYEKARETFLSMKNNVDVGFVGIDWQKYDRSRVFEFLKEKNFDERRINNGLDRYEKCRNKREQSRLSDMFKKRAK